MWNTYCLSCIESIIIIETVRPFWLETTKHCFSFVLVLVDGLYYTRHASDACFKGIKTLVPSIPIVHSVCCWFPPWWQFAPLDYWNSFLPPFDSYILGTCYTPPAACQSILINSSFARTASPVLCDRVFALHTVANNLSSRESVALVFIYMLLGQICSTSIVRVI